MNDGDRNQVKRAQEGDLEAFEVLVEKYKRSVYSIARSAVARHDDADDLSQEIFIRAFVGLKRFKGRSSFKTWLFRIAVNTSINFRSKFQGSAGREEELKETDAMRSEAGALDSLIQGQALEKLRELIGKLPGRQRKTLTLKIDAGLKYSEIAQVMGCSEGTAKANFFHAVSKLKAGIEELV